MKVAKEGRMGGGGLEHEMLQNENWCVEKIGHMKA